MTAATHTLLYVKLLLLSVGYPIVTCQCEGQCPDGWVYFKGSCYMFVDNMAMDWTEATHHCAAHRAHLVKIDNRAEDLFLQDMARRFFRASGRTMVNSFHTGGTDATVEGVWTWYSDNSDLLYTNWAPGQPETNSNVDQDCLFLTATDSYRWHDAVCGTKSHPLCELELTEMEIVG